MPNHAEVEPYILQNVPPAYRPFSQATEWYTDQHISFADQQRMKLPRGGYFLTTNLNDLDNLYKQQRPASDFTPQLQTLHRYYTVVDDDRTIIQLLEEEPQLYLLLLDAVEPLQQAFGDKRLIYIRVQTSDEDSILKVAVWLPADFRGDPERALQAFDENWWLKNCHRAGGTLVFDYETQNAI